MAAKLASVRKSKPDGFMVLLLSAACEWFLIYLLFVDALFSYLLRKFAQFCELQTPCPLCSRLDHVFEKKKPGFYWSLVCDNHKQEISSLVSCSAHGKLADVHWMCEECLMPIAVQNNSESHKLLVGKMLIDVDRSVLQNLMVNKHIKLGLSESRICSCCDKAWKSKSNAERLVQLNKAGLGASKVSAGASKVSARPPLPRVPSQTRLRRRNSLKRLKGKLSAAKRQQPTGSNGAETSSHMGYSKLKFSSVSDTECLLSEDDENDGNVCCRCNTYMKPKHDVGHDRGNQTCLTMDLTSLNEASQPSEVGFLDPTVETSGSSLSQSSVSELPFLRSVPSPSNTLTFTEKSINVGGAHENMNTSAAETSSDVACSIILKDKNKDVNDSRQSTENMELSFEHEMELTYPSDPMSQVSTSDVGLLLKDTISGPHDEHHETRKEEDSNSQSLKTNDSSYESLKGINADDIESESIVDQLKRQVENDQSFIESLYKELDEERNAAAIAANEAMAMITRLQEEKAALKMEAMQYLRMMEEQSEYDRKALDRANDLLTEREKELQDLEYELDFLRNNLPDELRLEDFRTETSVLENNTAAWFENSPGISSDLTFTEISKAIGERKHVDSSASNFEDENSSFHYV